MARITGKILRGDESQFVLVLEMVGRRVASTPRVERTERLEGSRFVTWQFYGLLAGGSRERLEVRQFYGPVVFAARKIDTMGKTLRWVVPGSGLQLTDRAAIL